VVMDSFVDSVPTVPDLRIDPLEAYGILKHLPLGVLLCELDPDRRHPLVLANATAAEILRLPDGADDHHPIALEDAATLEFGEPLLGGLKEAGRRGGPLTRDWVLEANGQTRHIACNFVPLRRSKTDEAPRVLCTLADRTAEHLAESRLLHHALHDGLTGLPNRSLFLNRLQDRVTAPANGESAAHCAVLIVNVDRFQLINEGFGHQVGDAFLTEFAQDLAGCMRSNDLLARFDGDEFAILLPNITGTVDAQGLAARIHDLMAAPRQIGDTLAPISASIGIATTFTSPRHPEDLIRDADVAMHRAKRLGRASTELFRRETSPRITGQIRLEAALRDAIRNDELELFYQPILDLESGHTVAFEALARWHHPERGFISPGEFIPMAEESGLIMPLGRWAIAAAARQLATWQAAFPGHRPLQMAINLSPVQILQEDLGEIVAECLETTGLEPGQLRLEITEGALIADPEKAAETLQRIKALGISLAIDDFGTGYSSLSYLHRFPIDCIKIDRAFIGRIDSEDSAAKIVRSIMMLAEALDMHVIAEGIENREQLMRMRELGCRLGQGFLFAGPLPYGKAENFLGG